MKCDFTKTSKPHSTIRTPEFNVIHHIFRAAGVTEVELTQVVTLEINPVVVSVWRDQEASGPAGEIIYLLREDEGHGVDPLCPVTRFGLVVAENVGQLSGSRVIPGL